MAQSRTKRARSRPHSAVRERVSGVYRDAILAAAFDEFTDRGYAATKMLDVAQRAGLSVGALYRYFDSKEAIFVSLMEVGGDRMKQQLAATASGVLDPRERIAALIADMLTHIEENRGMYLVMSQLRDADKAACHALVEQARCTRDQIFTTFKNALDDGVRAGALRDDVSIDDQLSFVSGAMHGFLESWIRGGAEERLVAKAPLIARLTLTALGAPK